MAAVGSHVPLVSPVLGAEHHEHKDSGKFHKPRPTRSERVKRGRQRDKARLQALRDQLADFSTSSASASDNSSQHSALTQRLNAALSRVSALEERIDHLLAIIAHLTATADDTSGQASQGATAELFDLFKDHVADAETQTSISFDWSRPDVFVHLQDLEQCASFSRASSHTCDAAHADAAAGVASAISGLRSQFKVSKEVFSSHEDFNSQVGVSTIGAHSPQPCAFGASVLSARPGATRTDEQCSPRKFELNSQDLAKPLDDHVPTQCEHSSLATGLRLALDGAHSEHRSTSSKEDSSRTHEHLAEALGLRQALDEVNSEHRSTSAHVEPGLRLALEDGNSEHRNACAKEHSCGLWPHDGTQLAHGGSSTMHRVALPQDINSQVLAPPPRPDAFGANVPSARPDAFAASAPCSPHMFETNPPDSAVSSAHLVGVASTQCRLPTPGASVAASHDLAWASKEVYTRLALDDDNSEHRVVSTSVATALSFGPSARELEKTQDVLQQSTQCGHLTVEPGLRSALDDDHSEHRNACAKEHSCGHLPHVGTQLAHDGSLLLHRVALSQDFKSQDLATSPKPVAFGANVPSARQVDTGTTVRGCHATDVAQPVLPLAFVEVATNIIGVHLKRKKPSRNHIETSANALARVSKMHGVTRDMCRQFVESRSLVLGAALTESIF